MNYIINDMSGDMRLPKNSSFSGSDDNFVHYREKDTHGESFKISLNLGVYGDRPGSEIGYQSNMAFSRRCSWKIRSKT